MALLACQKILKTRGLTHDTLSECEPLLDTMASVRVRHEFAAISTISSKRPPGWASMTWACRSVPTPSNTLWTDQAARVRPSRMPIAWRCASRRFAVYPTPEEAQQVLEITVAQQRALTDGLSSLTKQRRRCGQIP